MEIFASFSGTNSPFTYTTRSEFSVIFSLYFNK